MNITPEWIALAFTFTAGVGTVIKVMLDFNRVVDRNTFVMEQIVETINRMRETVDGHGERLNDHGERITKVETWADYHGSHK